jgi:hypothetical protein
MLWYLKAKLTKGILIMSDDNTGFVVLIGIILAALLALSAYPYLSLVPLISMVSIIAIADHHLSQVKRKEDD